jgi:hypothetical protein
MPAAVALGGTGGVDGAGATGVDLTVAVTFGAARGGVEGFAFCADRRPLVMVVPVGAGLGVVFFVSARAAGAKGLVNELAADFTRLATLAIMSRIIAGPGFRPPHLGQVQ